MKPKHLRPEAEGKFNELRGLINGTFKEGDENLLAVLANCYLYLDGAWEEIDRRGLVITGDKMDRKNPAHEIARDMISRISDLSKHFGLSPLSRGEKFGKGDKEEPDGLDKL